MSTENPINMICVKVVTNKLLTTHIDSTDGKAAASYPGNPGLETSPLHAAACRISVSATDPADNE